MAVSFSHTVKSGKPRYGVERWTVKVLDFGKILKKVNDVSQPGTGTSTFQSFLKVVFFFAISLLFGETSRSAI